ncbi:MAG: zinc ribbon domain-containing protein [Planctomycetes bacterium]|nr:zinc ribbon domain-containing protein [Planctomycetota bacterium]
MPIFEYICGSCGKTSEFLVSNRDQQVVCPECGEEKLERKFSTFSAHQGGSSQPPCAERCPSGGSCCSSCPMSG